MLLSSADFFSKSTFSKISFTNTIRDSECQTVWIQIRTNIMLVLIWVQTVCKVYQQTTKVASRKGKSNPYVIILIIIPGHRLAECVVYKGSKDLERYRSLVFRNQLISCQIELMDSSAQLVLPVLKSLDPASRYECY